MKYEQTPLKDASVPVFSILFFFFSFFIGSKSRNDVSIRKIYMASNFPLQKAGLLGDNLCAMNQ